MVLQNGLFPTSEIEALTCSPADSPARGSVRRTRTAPDSPTSGADCGSQCSLSLPESDPPMWWLKTSLTCTLAALTSCYPVWKRRVTPAGRSWWVVGWSVPLTSATEFLSSRSVTMFPTPMASNWEEDPEVWQKRHAKKKAARTPGGACTPPLATFVRSMQVTSTGGKWRTPLAADGRRGPCKNMNGTPQLALEVKNEEAKRATSVPPRWATPAATDAQGSHGGGQGRSLRTDLARLKRRTTPGRWATPTCQAAKNNGSPSQHERNSLPLDAQAGGALNPEWVEMLMGFPVGWTEVSGSFPSQRRRPKKGRSSGTNRPDSKRASPTAKTGCADAATP